MLPTTHPHRSIPIPGPSPVVSPVSCCHFLCPIDLKNGGRLIEAIGAAAILLIIGAIIFYCVRRSRRKRAGILQPQFQLQEGHVNSLKTSPISPTYDPSILSGSTVVQYPPLQPYVSIFQLCLFRFGRWTECWWVSRILQIRRHSHLLEAIPHPLHTTVAVDDNSPPPGCITQVSCFKLVMRNGIAS